MEQKENQKLNKTPRLLEKYRKEVIPALRAKFGYKSVMAVPKITRVTINTGIGRMFKDPKAIERVKNEISKMTGQKWAVRRSKK